MPSTVPVAAFTTTNLRTPGSESASTTARSVSALVHVCARGDGIPGLSACGGGSPAGCAPCAAAAAAAAAVRRRGGVRRRRLRRLGRPPSRQRLRHREFAQRHPTVRVIRREQHHVRARVDVHESTSLVHHRERPAPGHHPERIRHR